jgi:penicillin-binding protein 1C
MRLNWRKGRVVSGGSTLTMQLARLATRQDDDSYSRGYGRKLYEAVLALRLELAYSKPQILALYASHAPFGGNVVGLEAAAWRYFGRAPETLSWAEAATLAVLPNAPSLVTPGRNRQALQIKRDKLLQRLHKQGVLTDLDLQLALAEPLVAAPRALPELAPHLLETLRARYPQQHRFASTLDAELQSFAMQAVKEHSATLQTQGIGNAEQMVEAFVDFRRIRQRRILVIAAQDARLGFRWQTEQRHLIRAVNTPIVEQFNDAPGKRDTLHLTQFAQIKVQHAVTPAYGARTGAGFVWREF